MLFIKTNHPHNTIANAALRIVVLITAKILPIK